MTGMNFLIGAAFLILFIIIYFAMQFYAVTRLLGFFPLHLNPYLLSGIFTLLFPAATIIDMFFHSIVTRIFYLFAGSVAGTLFILFFCLLVLELVNLITPIFSKPIAGIILIIFILAVSIFSIINASGINIKEITIDNFGADARIVQISDAHIGTARNSAFLGMIIEKTNSLNPDAVVITGDLVDGTGKLSANTFEPLNRINAPTYAIMGNHEFYEGEQKVKELLSKTKVKVLMDESVETLGINIVGLDYSEKRSYAQDHLRNISYERSKPTILLNHVPIGYEAAEKAGVNLQLSGHTHNGQIFPFTLFVRMAFSKINGLYKIGGMSLYVSPGTGTWGPPMRLGSRNEITLFNLKK
jgi:uncharacterized protein